MEYQIHGNTQVINSSIWDKIPTSVFSVLSDLICKSSSSPGDQFIQ